MATITILGAGYMGSALAMIAASRGQSVRLWGTWLDDELVAPPMRGEAHPRLELKLPPGVELYHHGDLEQALQGTDAVVCAVNSDGVLPVFERAVAHLPPGGPLLSVTKGFLTDREGRIGRISQVLEQRVLGPAGKSRPFVHIGGPCKAMEVVRGVWTVTVYASNDRAALEQSAAWLEADNYTISLTDDLAGTETCSAFKNAYATALGICDGLQLSGHPEMHNTRAMLFAQAIAEIARMVQAMGGDPRTAHGQAAVGDLHVTAAAGRNRTFGEHVGRGEPPDQVADRMRATGELTEGYPALQTGWRLLTQLVKKRLLQLHDFPLLAALHQVVHGGADVAQTLAALRLR
jgi:glycerol-3-phosphate dehydrogenase (NAD(P)+)